MFFFSIELYIRFVSFMITAILFGIQIRRRMTLESRKLCECIQCIVNCQHAVLCIWNIIKLFVTKAEDSHEWKKWFTKMTRQIIFYLQQHIFWEMCRFEKIWMIFSVHWNKSGSFGESYILSSKIDVPIFVPTSNKNVNGCKRFGKIEDVLKNFEKKL